MPLASYVHICHPGMPDPQTAQDLYPGSRPQIIILWMLVLVDVYLLR
jgi:hypothetical protein